MQDDLLRHSDEQVIGDQGARIVQGVLPPAWVYRDLEGKGEYGIDAEVEIVDDRPPTRLSFRVQLRSVGFRPLNSNVLATKAASCEVLLDRVRDPERPGHLGGEPATTDCREGLGSATAGAKSSEVCQNRTHVMNRELLCSPRPCQQSPVSWTQIGG